VCACTPVCVCLYMLASARVCVFSSVYFCVCFVCLRPVSGCVCLCVIVQGTMAASRLALVTSAFQSLSPSIEQTVSLDTMRKKYAAQNHPDVKAGRVREADCLREFLTSVDLGGDGVVCAHKHTHTHSLSLSHTRTHTHKRRFNATLPSHTILSLTPYRIMLCICSLCLPTCDRGVSFREPFPHFPPTFVLDSRCPVPPTDHAIRLY
jgi:hypothetical protein